MEKAKAFETKLPIRISVNLQNFFNDHRKNCWLLIDFNKMKTVQDLKNYLKNYFKIPSENVQLELLLNNFLLLNDNHLSVLQDKEQVSLINVYTQPLDDNKSPNKRKASTPVPAVNEIKNNTNKAQKVSPTTAPAAKNTINKAQKVSPTPVPVNKNNAQKLLLTSISPLTATIQEKKVLKATPTPVSTANVINNTTAEIVKPVVSNGVKENDLTEGLIITPKKKRARKRKKKKKNVELQPNSTDESSVNEEIPVSLPRNNSAVHIRFDADDDNSSGSPKENKKMKHTSSSPLPFYETLELLKTNHYWDGLTEEYIWNLPEVINIPKKYDIVAFKVLCLNENYCPEISEWVIAYIKAVERGILTMSILRGTNPYLSKANGKFDVEETEEESMNTDNKLLIVEWQNIMKPRKLELPSQIN